MTSPTDLAPQLVGEWEGSQGRGRVGGGNREWLRKGWTEDRRELEQEGQGQTGGQAVEWAVEWLVRECESQLFSGVLEALKNEGESRRGLNWGSGKWSWRRSFMNCRRPSSIPGTTKNGLQALSQ